MDTYTRSALVVDEIETTLSLSQLERFVLADALREYAKRHPRKLVADVANDIRRQMVAKGIRNAGLD